MGFKRFLKFGVGAIAAAALGSSFGSGAQATPFTTTVPGEGISLPDEYPEAGGVAIVMIGTNGNVYYQFSDPSGAFVGFQNTGQPTAFRGNPFTINDPLTLDCGFRSCTDYFGGSIDRMYVRFSAWDGDTQDGNGQPQGFDFNRINLVMNGVDVGNWSDRTTELTSNDGTQSFGFQTGFGNNSFNTGWFSTTNQTLLNNVLTTGQTTTQVRDDTPNDNYWDFRRGPTLGNVDLQTIAPGYEFLKEADVTEFTAVGQIVTYTYTVTNIGSVNIFDVAITDDKVDTITCDRTTIPLTEGGPGAVAETAICTGTYEITQEDFDNQSVTNIASASGRPEFGSLGTVDDTVTITGPAFDARFTLEKEADRAAFSAVGEQITYTYTLTNTGDATLSTMAVTDDKIPGQICTVATLPPVAAAPANVTTCSATYTVTQDDLDDFALDGTLLTNVANATAQDPNGVAVSTAPATETVSGPAAQPSMIVAKTALQPNFSAVGDVIQFEIEVINDGNVTWPTAPTITDDLITNAGGAVSCPAGEVAPMGTIVCTASYSITQPDLDAGEVENIAEAEITVGGATAMGQGDVTVPAVVTRDMTIVKRLPAGDPTTYSATTDEISYEYVLTNTGTVTLLNPTITDDKVNASCADTSIAPGASIVCTSDAPYDVEQGDLDAGQVTNIASASAGTQTGDTVTTPDTSLTVSADQMPALLMEKSAPVPAIQPVDFVPGLMIEYTYTITNTGNTTITDQIQVTDDKIGAPFNCGSGSLAPMGVRTCTATYEVTPNDAFVDGFVTNRATASDGTTTSNEDSVTVPQSGSPALGLTKTPAPANPTFNALNQPLSYIFTVQNTGDTTITFPGQPITVNDPKITAVDCSAQPASFGPGDTFDCTGTYTGVTQGEIDAGEVLNSATATFTAPSGAITSPAAEATIPTAIVPELSLAKDGPASFGAVGSTVTYTFTVTNETPQTISTASVTDPKIPALVCDFTDIGPNASVTCTGDYTVTQADLDQGSIDNTATVNGVAPTGELLNATASETVTADPAALVRSLSLDKSADVASFAAVGDDIDYTFAVTNTGTLTLTDITVTDPTVGLTCTIPTLAPMQTNDTLCQATHTVIQADLDRGNFENTATVTAAGVTPDADDTDTVDTLGPTRTSTFTVEKTANDTSDVQVGQIITYSHVVTNTGNTTLTDITLTDTHTSASGTTTLAFTPSNVIATLAPMASQTVTTSYTVTQEDIDAQADLTNTVTATATPVTGLPTPTATDDEVVDVADAAPALTVAKTEADGSGTFDNLPTTETFTFEVNNTGNITLSGFTLTDDLTGFSCVVADVPVGGSATQCVNGDPLSTTYTVLQADVDRAGLTNDVTVTDGTLTATDRVTLAGPTQTIVLNMVKTATAGDNFTDIGDVVTYDYDVTNGPAGSNVTIVNPITIVDDRTTVTCPPLPIGGLAVGATLTCSASYTITQPDLDAGSVLNRATASVTQALAPDAATNGPTTISSNEATETVNAAQSPSLDIEKVQTPNTPTTFSDPLDPVSYDFTVTNNGNVTLPGPITIDDDQIGNGLACGAGPLAVGDSVTCTHIWPATQIAIDAGQITNTASGVATFNGNPVPSDTAMVTVLALQDPSLAIVKAFESITANTYAAGNEITYSFTVTNDGNTTIVDEPVITDSLITNPADITIDAPFPVGGMLPGDVVTYEGTYVLTLDDIRLGSVTNTASATSGPITSPPSSVTTPEDVEPAITVVKSTTATGFEALNDPIVYTYTVENTSEGTPPTPIPALANPITITDDKFPGQTIACEPAAGGQLGAGETTTCTATYFVTQADLDAGSVTNSAFAQTTFGAANVFSPVDDVTVTGTQNPVLGLEKEVIAGPNPAEVDDVLTYRLTASNDGNQTLSNVAIVDDRVPTLTCTVGGAAAVTPVSLLPGETLVCEGDYTVTQDDFDLQVLSNTADATATNPAGLPQTATQTATHPLEVGEPEVEVIKDLAAGEPGSAYSTVDEQLTFVITVRNIGDITLTSTTVTDSIVPGTCTIGVLAPGDEDTTCEFVYTVTQDDIDNGSIDNTVTTASQPATPGAPSVPGSATLTSLGPAFEPALAMSKTADIASFDEDDVLITYSYIVANTGNITLTELPVITDDKIANVSCPALPGGELAPTESITCTATYLTTQEDVDNGGVTNVATVSSSEAPFDPAFPGNATATETVPSVRTPAVEVTKSASQDTDLLEGQTVTYSYLIENTGNVTLTDVTLGDQHTSATGTAALTILPSPTVASLLPGTDVTLTATYVVTQEDVDAGAPLTNIATVNANTEEGPVPAVTDDLSVTPEAADPEITALKVVSATTGTAVGDTVTFDITVENTGNVTLSGVTLSDTLRRQDGTLITPNPVPAISDGDGGTLSPDEIWTYQITHTLTQDDIDSGGLSNSATATGTPPSGPNVSDVSDTGTGTGSTPTPFAIPAMPSLTTEKTATVANTGVDETVTFEITVLNDGNVTLTSVGVTDTLTRNDGTTLTPTTGPDFAGADMASAEGTLLVGETATYVVTYRLTQPDVDAGGITNTATSTGTPPTGSPVTDPVDVPAVVPIAPVPTITMVKSLTAGGPTFDAVGDILEYAFTVTNTGNVTITDPITITDPLITNAGGTITCPAPPLAPMGVAVCTASYSIIQGDLDAGEVFNEATATVPDAPTVTDDVTVPAQQNPAMSLLKEAEFVTGITVGQVVNYTYTVTNTGNVTLMDEITVSDNLIPTVVCDALPAGGLLPGDDLTCRGDYTVTVNDVNLQVVTNLATATSGTTTSPQVSETIPRSATPALTVDKVITAVTEADGTPRAGNAFAEVDDLIEYEFTITNSGTQAFVNAIPIIDDRFADPIVCFVPSATDPDFQAGETQTCTATYSVTQADLDAGEVINSAFAQTTFGPAGSTTVTSPPDTATATVNADPSLEVVKAVDTATYAAIGDVLTYTFTVTNTGNQTLRNVTVTDALIPTLDCTVASLAPMGVQVCTDTITITQAELDDALVTNTASATGITPDGGSVDDDSDPVTSTAPTTPSTLTLVKSATPDPFGGVGTSITYGFAVTNDGPFTLENVEVTDPLVPAFSCIIARINVGQTDTTCRMPYTVTQADVDTGSILNEATATGTSPAGLTSTATDEITTPGPAIAPSLVVVKTADVPATTVGSIVTYTVTVENTGNVTLLAPSLTDTMERIDTGRPTFLTTPFVYQSGDLGTPDRLDVDEVWTYTATYQLTQSDVNAGGVSNSVTATALVTTPDMTSTSDVSDDGIGGNGDDNPTLVPIVRTPVLDVVKSIVTPAARPGETVTFRIEAFNRGNVSIENVQPPVDTLTRRGGTDISAGVSAPVLQPSTGNVTSFDPGLSLIWEVTYVLTSADVDAGGIENIAVVSGTSPTGDPVTATSSDDDPSDGNPANDPTELSIAPTPSIETVKVDVSAPAPTEAGQTVTYTITAENTGNVTLTGVTLADTLTNLAGDPLTPDTITPSPTAGVTLVSDAVQTWTVTYVLQQADIDAGGVSNTATATGLSPTLLPVSDVSDDGNDTDGNTFDDPTQTLIAPDNTLNVAKAATTPARITGTEFETVFTITVENAGNVTQTNMSVVDDMTAFVAPATLVSVSAPTVTGLSAGGANAGYDGVGTTETLAAGSSLLPGDTATITITVRYDVAAGSPGSPNTASVTTDRVTTPVTGTANVPASTPEPDVLADKSITSAGPYLAGSVVNYELTFTNRNSTPEIGLSLVDLLPVGMTYVPDSALYNGAATPAPAQTGRMLTWADVTLAPGETVTITLSALLLDGAGSFTNRAYALDSTGVQVSNTAAATIDIVPEAVFDCGDVIGKVFDDRNGNGYQDAPNGNPAISDQAYDGDGKFRIAPETIDQQENGEPGIPGVKLVTVRGDIITTDEYGRFSVPCALLPGPTGSNFTLKIDERSLPTGYRVNTENPRTMRLTSGIMTEMNFGVSLANLVDIDLLAAAFETGSTTPNAALVQGVNGLVNQIAQNPSVLRITYYTNGESDDVARARLAATERLIRDAWHGRYRLRIETTIARVQ